MWATQTRSVTEIMQHRTGCVYHAGIISEGTADDYFNTMPSGMSPRYQCADIMVYRQWLPTMYTILLHEVYFHPFVIASQQEMIA